MSTVVVTRLVCCDVGSRPTRISSVMDDQYVLRPWCRDIAVLRGQVVNSIEYDWIDSGAVRRKISADVAEVVDPLYFSMSSKMVPMTGLNLVLLMMDGDDRLHGVLLVGARLHDIETKLIVAGRSAIVTRATWTYREMMELS